MTKTLLIALRATLLTLVFTGFVYPLLVFGVGQLLFPARANGSLVTDPKGAVVGSDLIGQRFIRAGYLQGRPSAAGNDGYDASASSGSNLGPTSAKLHERVVHEVARLRRENPEMTGAIPTELVTASASGLDPHLSPEAAMWQVARIARARKVVPSRVESVVRASIEGRDLGFLGEPRLNVLRANLALDRVFGKESGEVAAAVR